LDLYGQGEPTKELVSFEVKVLVYFDTGIGEIIAPLPPSSLMLSFGTPFNSVV